MSVANRGMLTLLISLLASLLLLSACGGGDDDDEGDGGVVTVTAGSGDDEPDTSATPVATPDGDDDSGDARFDSCELLTADEVSEALGAPVGEGELTDIDPFFDCSWESEEFDSVSVSVYLASRPEVEAFFDATEDAEPVEGLGDRAQYSGFGFLEVLKGESNITISLINFDIEDDEKLEILKGLAAKVLERLPD